MSEEHEIEACLERYGRGADRLDEELLLSVFHDDATIETAGETLNPRTFVEWLWARAANRVAMHYVMNATIDLDGDTAHVETYNMAATRTVGRDVVGISGGRYIDRFERRDGTWRIAYRVVVPEWAIEAPGRDLAGIDALTHASKDRSDISYRRPLGS